MKSPQIMLCVYCQGGGTAQINFCPAKPCIPFSTDSISQRTLVRFRTRFVYSPSLSVQPKKGCSILLHPFACYTVLERNLENDMMNPHQVGNLVKYRGIMSDRHRKMMGWRFRKPFFHIGIRIDLKLHWRLRVANCHNRSVGRFRFA